MKPILFSLVVLTVSPAVTTLMAQVWKSDRMTSPKDIYILRDGSAEAEVDSILRSAGFSVTMGPLEKDFTGGDLSSYGAVILLDAGNAVSFVDMPQSGQSALVNYVRSGGGLLITEGVAWESASPRNRYALLDSLMPVRYAGMLVTTPPPDTFIVVRHNIVTSNLPDTFTISTGSLSKVTARTTGDSVYIRGKRSGDAVVAKNFAKGKVLYWNLWGNTDAFGNSVKVWTSQTGGLLKNIIAFLTGVVVSVEQSGSAIPTSFVLSQNFPNPFNPSTSFEIQVPSFEFVRVIVYDMLGRELATLVNEVKSPGTYRVTWEAANLPSGVYYYRLTAANFLAARKMVLLK